MTATLRTAFGFLGLMGGLVGLGLACTAEVDEPNFNPASASATDTATDTDASSGGFDDAASSSSSSTTAMSADADSSTSGSNDDTTTTATTNPSTTGNNSCGDGMISPGEQCDGGNLQNFDCGSLGLGTGTLLCDPVTCTFDTSMCMNTTSGTSG